MPKHDLKYYLRALLRKKKRFTPWAVEWMAKHLEDYLDDYTRPVDYKLVGRYIIDICLESDTKPEVAYLILNNTIEIVELCLEFSNNNEYYFLFKFREPLPPEAIEREARQRKDRAANRKKWEQERIEAGYMWHKFPPNPERRWNKNDTVLIPAKKPKPVVSDLAFMWYPLNKEGAGK